MIFYHSALWRILNQKYVPFCYGYDCFSWLLMDVQIWFWSETIKVRWFWFKFSTTRLCAYLHLFIIFSPAIVCFSKKYNCAFTKLKSHPQSIMVLLHFRCPFLVSRVKKQRKQQKFLNLFHIFFLSTFQHFSSFITGLELPFPSLKRFPLLLKLTRLFAADGGWAALK